MWGDDGFGDTSKALFAPKQIIKTIDLLFMHYDLILEKLKTCLWFLTDEEPDQMNRKWLNGRGYTWSGVGFQCGAPSLNPVS